MRAVKEKRATEAMRAMERMRAMKEKRAMKGMNDDVMFGLLCQHEHFPKLLCERRRCVWGQ